jgi:solute carrier family 25 phosphate transporter 3
LTQTNPELYPGIISGFATLGKQGGYTIGWAPTLIGYSMQGFCKFGFYEIFKVCNVHLAFRMGNGFLNLEI